MLFAFLTFANYQKYTSFRKHSIGKKNQPYGVNVLPLKTSFQASRLLLHSIVYLCVLSVLSTAQIVCLTTVHRQISLVVVHTSIELNGCNGWRAYLLKPFPAKMKSQSHLTLSIAICLDILDVTNYDQTLLSKTDWMKSQTFFPSKWSWGHVWKWCGRKNGSDKKVCIE